MIIRIDLLSSYFGDAPCTLVEVSMIFYNAPLCEWYIWNLCGWFLCLSLSFVIAYYMSRCYVLSGIFWFGLVVGGCPSDLGIYISISV